MITEQQKKFCREFIIDFKILPAMVRSGYSRSYADRAGYKLMRKPEIAGLIKELMEKQITKQALSAEMVIEEMRRLAMSNIADYYKWSDKKKKSTC